MDDIILHERVLPGPAPVPRNVYYIPIGHSANPYWPRWHDDDDGGDQGQRSINNKGARDRKNVGFRESDGQRARFRNHGSSHRHYNHEDDRYDGHDHYHDYYERHDADARGGYHHHGGGNRRVPKPMRPAAPQRLVDFTFACYEDGDTHLGDITITDCSPWAEMCDKLQQVASGHEACFTFMRGAGARQ